MESFPNRRPVSRRKPQKAQLPSGEARMIFLTFSLARMLALVGAFVCSVGVFHWYVSVHTNNAGLS